MEHRCTALKPFWFSANDINEYLVISADGDGHLSGPPTIPSVASHDPVGVDRRQTRHRRRFADEVDGQRVYGEPVHVIPEDQAVGLVVGRYSPQGRRDQPHLLVAA